MFGADFEGIAVVDLIDFVADFEEHEAHVEGVAVEDAGEAVADHGADACADDGEGRVFTGGTAAEVAARHDDVAFVDALDPAGFEAFHAGFAELAGIGGDEETGRDDGVGINMRADLMNFSGKGHG